MKQLLLFLGFTLFTTHLFSQTKIDLADVSKHVGDSVTLEGKVYGVKTFPDNPKAPTLLNLGADFPKQTLTVAVFASYATETIVMPNEASKGNNARVTGKIELYKGRPQIVVRTASQLYLSSPDAITPAKQ